MVKKQKKRSIFARIRNYFIAGIVVLNSNRHNYILNSCSNFNIFKNSYLTKLTPNHYLPYNIPGVEILIIIGIDYFNWIFVFVIYWKKIVRYI